MPLSIRGSPNLLVQHIPHTGTLLTKAAKDASRKGYLTCVQKPNGTSGCTHSRHTQHYCNIVNKNGLVLDSNGDPLKMFSFSKSKDNPNYNRQLWWFVPV